jgi:hypothetical protein
MVERSCLVLLNSPSQQGVDHFNFVPWNLHGISTPSNPKKKKKKNLRVSKSVNSQLISKVKLIKIHKWLSIYIYIYHNSKSMSMSKSKKRINFPSNRKISTTDQTSCLLLLYHYQQPLISMSKTQFVYRVYIHNFY